MFWAGTLQSNFLFRTEGSSWLGEKASLWRRSKRGSGENGAGNRRAMRISNSWGEATWELSGDMPREQRNRGALGTINYPKIVKNKNQSKVESLVDASIMRTERGVQFTCTVNHEGVPMSMVEDADGTGVL